MDIQDKQLDNRYPFEVFHFEIQVTMYFPNIDYQQIDEHQ